MCHFPCGVRQCITASLTCGSADFNQIKRVCSGDGGLNVGKHLAKREIHFVIEIEVLPAR